MSSRAVLLVEDDPDVREDLAYLLQQKGYSVDTAENGREALQRIQETGAPCIVLLDLMMPVMDGWEFRAAMLKEPALREVPVVLVSGVADLTQDARLLKAADYLTKPVNLKRLYALVEQYCPLNAST